MNAMMPMSSTSCQRSCVRISGMARLQPFRRAEAKRVGDAHDVGASERGGDGGREASLQPLIGTEIENSSDESLPRSADEEREAERGERGQSAQQRQVVVEILAEADARIDDDVVRGDADCRGF